MICRYLDGTELMRELLAELPRGGPPIEVHAGDPDRTTLRALLQDADIVLDGHTFLDAELLAGAPRLRSIVFLGSGASSYIDLDAARERGIAVRTVTGYGDRAVAEHTFALLLAAARGVAVMDRELRSGVWSPREGVELRGRTLGVIGLGGIGRELVRIGAGFGMEVLAWNRSPVMEPLPCEQVPLDALLGRSDAVSLHLALTPGTRGFLDRGRIAAMKPGAILVNTARAGLLDAAALADALERGTLLHAALDVFDVEPIPASDPLTSLSHVTLTAHAAFKTRDASRNLLLRAARLLKRDADDLAAGHPLQPPEGVTD